MNSIPTTDSCYSIVRGGFNAPAVAAKLPLWMMYSTLWGTPTTTNCPSLRALYLLHVRHYHNYEQHLSRAPHLLSPCIQYTSRLANKQCYIYWKWSNSCFWELYLMSLVKLLWHVIIEEFIQVQCSDSLTADCTHQKCMLITLLFLSFQNKNTSISITD